MLFECAPNHRGRSSSGKFTLQRDWYYFRRVCYAMCDNEKLFSCAQGTLVVHAGEKKIGENRKKIKLKWRWKIKQ